VIGDATITDVILDRVILRNVRFTLTGDSQRAERQKTQKRTKISTHRDDSHYNLAAQHQLLRNGYDSPE
jgi:hypothetical protein